MNANGYGEETLEPDSFPWAAGLKRRIETPKMASKLKTETLKMAFEGFD